MVSAIAGSQSIWYKSMCTQRRVPLSADGLDVIGDGPVVVDGPADVCADPVVIDAGPVVIMAVQSLSKVAQLLSSAMVNGTQYRQDLLLVTTIKRT